LQDPTKDYNGKVDAFLEEFFTWVYVIEMVLKISAMGYLSK